ncbi:MAG: cbb3-type cytochrome oxidase assembly protein CcoS [Deltaproteobacteria bacterium]|nr:cbb3-type cytochrome oxidase assembly protein CcoS [Deltaproteobacteria bacterium]
MGIVYVLLPASLLLATLGVAAFVWAARSRQFDGVEVSGAKLLFERDEAPAAGEGRDANRGKQS